MTLKATLDQIEKLEDTLRDLRNDAFKLQQQEAQADHLTELAEGLLDLARKLR